MQRSIFLSTARALLFLSAAAMVSAQTEADPRWVGTWSAAPDSPGASLQAQTIRQIVRTSVGGSRVRIRLSNLFGSGPVTIGPAHLALHATGSGIQPGSDHALSFGGRRTIVVPKGGSAVSDPVGMEVAAFQELVVSLYLPTRTGPSTVHGAGLTTVYLTLRGDATAAVAFPEGETTSSRLFLTDVEVAGRAPARAFVAFGDSVTDGVGSTPDSHGRWPDALAARLQADPATAGIAVINAGIAGNRLLNGGSSFFVGPSGLSRFDRDVLGKPGVRWVLLLEGINDIAGASVHPTAKDDVSAQQIIDGMKALITRAHKRGVRIWGATLLPFAGGEWPFHSAAGEVKRQAVNAWIRSSGAFDAVVDFERTVRDPAHPDRLLPSYDSGDHLHPNDDGYKAMAAAIDVRLLAEAP